MSIAPHVRRLLGSIATCLALTAPLGAADVTYRLESLDGAPGTEVRVPFSIESDAEVRAFSVIINFDESVLQVTGAESVYVVPSIYNRNPTYPTEYEPGINWAFHFVRFDNSDNEPGDGDDEGVIKGSGVFSIDDYVTLPVGQPSEIFAFDFKINDDAPLGATDLRFQDFLVMENTGTDARNSVAVDPDVSVLFPPLDTYPILVHGQLNIVGDVSLFTRGDANRDGALDVSDPTATLGYLFAGLDAPPCPDAADANDDGVLDVSDPIATLGFLFLGHGELPAPFHSPGTDPTIDALECVE